MLETIVDDLDAGRGTLPAATLADLRDGRLHAQHAVQVMPRARTEMRAPLVPDGGAVPCGRGR